MEKAVSEYDIDGIKKLFNEAISKDDNNDAKEVINALFEKTSRSKAMNMIKCNAPVEEIEKLFLFIVEAAKADLCPKVLTVSVIQDLLECSKKSKCSEIFSIVENHIGIWKTKEFFDQCKNSVLRMCNDMLKRLSRTIDTQFCGRINILLARSLPLNEKSGLNPTGQFNAANETEYNLELDESELKTTKKEEGDAIDIDLVQEIPVDFALYQEFWELQKFFCDPNKIYQKNEFDTFQKNLNNVIGVFTTYKLDKKRTGSYSQAEDAMDGIEEGIIRPDVFFAKYQTSQNLLHLQFADPQFRRYFLVQCLILSNYLQSDVKFRDETYFLTDEQQRYINEMNDKCHKLLKDTFPRGHHFSEFVKKLLSREKIWSMWKNEGCPDWLSSRPERDVKSYQRKPLPSYNPNKIDLGNDALNRLWSQSSDNLSACKDPKRNFVPKLIEVISDALDHADPEQGVEEEYSCFNNEIWQWKYSRLFLTEGDNFLAIQSTPAARRPCPEFSETLKKGVFCIAMHHNNESMRERGKDISQKSEDYRIKKEEEAQKAEEEERQKKEEEAKRKAMEAAADRKKKDEELAAQRAKERANFTSKKAKKEEDTKEAEKIEEPKSARSDTKQNGTEPSPSQRKSRLDSKEDGGAEPSPSRREQPSPAHSRKEHSPLPPPRRSREHSPSTRREPSPTPSSRREKRRTIDNGSSTPSESRKRDRTPIEQHQEEAAPPKRRRNGNNDNGSVKEKTSRPSSDNGATNNRERPLKREKSTEHSTSSNRSTGGGRNNREWERERNQRSNRRHH
jgi:THO complex subunit 1